MKINVGEKWRLKSSHLKVATVTHAYPADEESAVIWGINTGDTLYLHLDMPWVRGGKGGSKHITTFLKQYEKVI